MPRFDQSLPLPIPPSDDNDETTAQNSTDAALKFIRGKVNTIYTKEPSALEEEQEILAAAGPMSKHQKYIKELMDSGKGLAEIQTKWHAYYQSLPDKEKHQVWNEFYENYGKATKRQPSPPDPVATAQTPNLATLPPERQLPTITAPVLGSVKPADIPEKSPRRSIAETKAELLDKVTARGKLKPKHHLQSLFFGLGMGLIVVVIIMFGFFNERFIAPFITPSRTASASPIIINPNEQVSSESKIIIPKINVDVPVVYNLASNDEKVIQANLENGVVQYPGTAIPGQNGNIVIVGHSSNNLLNTGKYKFAFVLLNRLQEGDTITMQYGGKRYVYKVYERVIVKPSDVSVLGATDKTASLTLITCDPPGTSKNRLVIRAEQISPSPTNNLASTTSTQVADTPEIVPGNAPSLFERLFSWL